MVGRWVLKVLQTGMLKGKVKYSNFNRHKEEKELLKKQIKEFNENYQKVWKENCTLESQILELRSKKDEDKHKYELELKSWHDKYNELNRDSQIKNSSLDSFKEKVSQLSSANVSEHEKYQKALKDLEDELKHNQLTGINSGKVKEQLEDENLRISTINKKLTQQLEEAKIQVRKFLKERSKLVKEIENLKKPTEFDKVLGKHSIHNLPNIDGEEPDLKQCIIQCSDYKKRYEKAEMQKEKIEKIMNSCIK